MVYFFQTLSLKVRFLGLLVLAFPVLGFQWLLTGAPWALARLKMVSHGVGVPDAQLWYSAQGLHTTLEAWGADGRDVYSLILWPSDLGFLLAYGAFLTAATLYLLKKANPRAPWWYLLPLLPLATSACDLLENFNILAVAWWPDLEWAAWAAGGLTTMKWSLFLVSAAVLVVGTAIRLVSGAWQKWKASQTDSV